MSLLYDKTLELLKNRPRGQTYAIIANETGLQEEWLKWFARDVEKEPSVFKTEILYNYLSGKKLEL